MFQKALRPQFSVTRSRHYFLVVRYVWLFLRVIGLAPLSLRRVDPQGNANNLIPINYASSKTGVIYNAILAALTIGSGYYSLPWRYRMHYDGKSSFTQNIDVLQNLLSITVLSTILVVYCIKQGTMIAISNRLIEVQRILDQFEVSFRPQRIFFRFFWISVLNSALFVVFVVSSAFEYTRGEALGYSVDIILPFVVSWLMLQYYLVVSLIDAKFVELNRSLQSLSKACLPESMTQTVCDDPRTLVSGTIVNCLKYISDVHTRLSQISNDVSDFFSVPVLFGLTYTLFCLTYNGYFLVIPFVSSAQESYTFMLNRIFYLICFMFPIIILTFRITKLMKEFTETGNALHDLLSCEMEKEARTRLKLFSMQLLHKKIKFTACGFFLLDTTLLQGILGTVTTYMVILIQLQPGSQDDTCAKANSTNCMNIKS